MKLSNSIKFLLIANIAVFILDNLLRLKGIELSDTCALYYIGNGMGFGGGKFMPHQIITYMFMHASFMHIFFNMFALWMFGRIMERYWDSKKFLIYYFVCGIGAGLTQEFGQFMGIIPAVTNLGPVCTLGASGAVFGILLAFGLTFPDERIFIIPIPFPIKAKYFVFFYAAVEVLEFLSVKDGVAHLAHLGGMLFGFLLIIYWKKNKDKDINNWKRNTTSSSRKKWGNIFGTQSGTYTSYEETSTSTHNTDYEYNARKRAQAAEVDRILDKIRKGGYESLSSEEKQTLFDASRK